VFSAVYPLPHSALFSTPLPHLPITSPSPFPLQNWAPWDETSSPGKIASGVVPGDLGFDPLNLKPKTEDAYRLMKTKELNNGRLAMLGVAGIVAQELVTKQSIF
jgi:hypothetical protein